MKAFSFVHASDLHLGYSQYGLEVRRQDFDNTFGELVDRTIELRPDFMVIAGDLFHQPRPSNVTLENAIRSFKRLRDAGIPVLTVDGSHDSAPNSMTGTILCPLDSAGLIYHLPRHVGACWRKDGVCYVYGVPNFRMRHKTDELLPLFFEQNPPMPDSVVCNVFVFHGALDLPGVKPPYMEGELSPELIPGGFGYYAGGHVHEPFFGKFKGGLLSYSGCTETVSYDEWNVKKGFNFVRVDEGGVFHVEAVELNSPRKFVVFEKEFVGANASKITEQASQLVRDADEEGVVVIPVLKGVLPAEASRSEVDLAHIRSSAEKALLVHPVVLLRESVISDDVVRSIFDSEFKDLGTKAFEYFLEIFSERYGREEAERIARAAVGLIGPLTHKEEGKVVEVLEGLFK